MKKIWLMIIFVIFVVGLVGWYMFSQGQSSFMLRDVKLEIIVPENTASGQEISCLVKYANKTKVALEQVELSFGENNHQNLGSLKPGQEGEIEFKKSFFGQENEKQIIEARLRYQPANFRSFFETKAQAEVKIKSSSIIASLTGPKQASNGQMVEYVLNYANKTENVFENIEINFTYPEGFTPQEQKNIWLIEKLEANQIGNLKIQGVLFGQDEEEKTITAKINEITQVSISTKIIGSPLLLEQIKTTDGYLVKYENKSQLSLSQAEITVQLESDAFDFETVDVQNGSFDKFAKKITWSSAGVPELEDLESGESGQLDFKIKLKNPLPQNNNFTLKSAAQIRAGDIQNSQELITKLDSQFILQAKAYYVSGQLPPKVGQITYYDVHWQLLNGANNITEAVVIASLPAAIEWHGVASNDRGRLYYDQASNEVVWDLGSVPAWVGRNQAVYEAVFRISLWPTASQAGKVVPILNETILTVKDDFTENILTSQQDYTSSDLPDDPNISYGQGVVQR
ncbi:MAG: hypothetical protein COX44_02840 [Candidatus Portnoybacteria bacterium CG23_combo_of_CG06-09_8_20_14_all_37_13]|uniref:DUF11 domain-containing protein n=1 Tax=Candidatus Portnoybacteria bacterium CG23_combo_of_CG06-09_8_20_14_all_37_13 TaxID=1974819 RepID=A0A2G9YCK2_9BACT|nr:MAG: hypothetical protein COX44_02840 [Candidatus Portnoybacteria bacterium CG23_combo_of_CG06-09_8_20_14_all_37_13]